MSPSGKRLFCAAAMVLLGAALLAGYRWSAARLSAPVDSRAGTGEPDARACAIMTVRYRVCGHAVRGSNATADARTLGEVLRDHPNAAVVMLPSGFAEVTIEADGLCPEDAPYRLLTVSEGCVAVYYGRSPVPAALKEIRRDLPVAQLSPSDVGRLEKGEVVLGDAAVSRLLEGLLD